ncbi:MAG: M48 family metallopeptidase [Pseudomonadota bacterium]
MNFFTAQDQARRNSRRLVIAYLLATILIVFGVTAIVGLAMYFATSDTYYGYTPAGFVREHAGLLAGVAIAATVLIVGSSLVKTAALSSGGGKVARQLGGTLVPADVSDPLRRRLRNVVEEMAIASGIPVPEIYVLEAEDGINAFAAGYTPGDAAVAVTRGTLELLDRNELQGVIAHEFSHILNGDMRLNIRLMGVLFGIMVIGLIGRFVLRGSRYSSMGSDRKGGGLALVLVVGAGLAILGGIGVFFARVIKAGVSRQREFLADASAVQFTRQSEGIANALKKIGGYSGGSKITAADPEEVSHMLFGSGAKFFGMFATHPPLDERIRALDPHFRKGDYPAVDRRQRAPVSELESQVSGFTDNVSTAIADGGTVVLAETIVDSVGDPANEHVTYASDLRRSIPESLYDAAHSSQFAYLLCIALILDRDGSSLERQLALANEQLGTERTRLLRSYYDELATTDPEFRLPLLEIAFPALKMRPRQELSYIVELAGRMIEIDGEIDLYEYCFYRFMTSSLQQAIDPRGRDRRGRAKRGELRAATVGLLRIVADYGHDNDAEREAAFRAGIETLGPWAHKQEFRANRDYTIAILNNGLDTLLGLNAKGQESLMRAIGATVAHDGKLAIAEAELLRAICATLDYPLPPILVHDA